MMDDHHTRLSEREIPEALDCANRLENSRYTHHTFRRSANELRRLHTQHESDQLLISNLIARQKELVEALKRLACLGNGIKWGTSEGNTIAQDALNKAGAQS